MKLDDRKVQQTRKCLTLISRIAARGASSPSDQHVVDTLFELTVALGLAGMPSAACHRSELGLVRMRQELDFIDSTSQGFTARDVLKYALQSTWN